MSQARVYANGREVEYTQDEKGTRGEPLRKRLLRKICEWLSDAIDRLDKLIDDEIEYFANFKPYRNKHAKGQNEKSDPSNVAGFCSICGRECLRTRNQEEDVFVVHEGRMLCARCYNALGEEEVEE